MGARGNLIVGNWKMNGLRADAVALAGELVERVQAEPPACELLVCPPATVIEAVARVLLVSGISIGGQDCHTAERGPYTGEISAEMLRDLGCSHVIIGHSERRQDFGETDALARAKVKAAWRAGLTAVLCVGETRSEHNAGRTLASVLAEVAAGVPEDSSPDKLVVAYEPFWAIGTDIAPATSDIVHIHAAIRSRLPTGTRILYGGSVTPKNAAEILKVSDVDGCLIGRASLIAEDFCAIAMHCR
jgi:triosephosphate isomerase (TIM)